MTNYRGQQIGNYRLIYLLGAGQFGEVYLAEHTHRQIQAQVAIKLLQPLARDDQRDLLRFLNEVRASHLKHPNIVEVYDFGVEGNIPFIVMAYAPHGTLRQRHPQGTLVPLSSIVSYVQQAASALQYIHDKGFIHRDIKPANMLIGAQGQILLGDFGIATISHSTLSQGQEEMAGTIPYVAPEQINGQPRPASDQYSLGMVVYEWLCGNCPFQGAIIEVMYKHQMVTPPKMPTISSEIEQVVMRALAKDPKQRFASILDFAQALEQAVSLSVPVPVPAQIKMPQPGSFLPPNSTSALNSSLPTDDIATKSRTHGSTGFWISRRRVVLGGVIAGSVAATGSLFWLTRSIRWTSKPTSSPTPHPTPHPTPPSTPVPLGKVLSTYKGHAGSVVNTVAWSPDSTRIASGSNDKTVQVWKVADGGLIFTYQDHTNLVAAVAWSPNGESIASGCFDRTVHVCNAIDGSFVYKYMGSPGSPVDTVAWSPDGKRIASGGYNGTIEVRNATDGSLVHTYKGHADLVSMVAWSSDSKYIASGSYDGTIQVWDAANGSLVHTYRNHAAHVEAVAWSPNGKHIASSGDDHTVQVWDATNGSLVYTYKGHSHVVNTVAWSPDSKRIASGGVDNTVQIWDALNGEHPFTYQQHAAEVKGVAWSPNGRLIASGSRDTTVQVWGVG